MTTRVGINGFGRMGRLALRAAWGHPAVEFVHINEVAGDAAAAAHLLEFDSQHGRWGHAITSTQEAIEIDGHRMSYSSNHTIGETPWARLRRRPGH